MFRSYVRFKKNGQLIQNRRPIEMVDFLATCLLRNALFSRSAVIRTFALAFSNCLQPTRTRRFPIKLSIKKRIFWSICGRPGFCSHIFAKLGSRPELVGFLLNCLLRNAFLSICGHPDFCNHIFTILGNQLELVGFLVHCSLRNAFVWSICGHPDFMPPSRAR